MPLEDKALRRRVEHEISKFGGLDITLLTVSVINNVVYLTGRVRRMRGPLGRGVDVKREMELLTEALLSMRGVNEVVMNAQIDA